MQGRGFIEPQINDTHWNLGAVDAPVVNESGDWRSAKPIGEKQRIRFETSNCTSFNWLNAIETYIKYKYDIDINFSDRWLGIVAGTTLYGNDPHKVAEAIRKNGLIPEYLLHYSENLNNASEYYSFKDADEDVCRDAGKEWLDHWEFYHEWVVNPQMNLTVEEKKVRIKEALKRSPLGLSVAAWTKQDGVYVKNPAERDNHWTSILCQDDLNRIFDSYEPYDKDLDVLYDFMYVKQFVLLKRNTGHSVQPENELQALIDRFLSWVQRVLTSLANTIR